MKLQSPPDDQKAELSREMTEPGTELVREADAQGARSSIGSTSSSASATWVRNTFESISDSSIDTHANVWQLYLAHCDSRFVLLSPAGSAAA